MSAAVLVLFILTSFLAILTPGPTVLLALSNGARFGVRRAVYGMLGAMLSDLVFIGAVSVGLGAVLTASETAFTVVKWIGVIYLFYLGVRLLRPSPHSRLYAPGAPGRAALPPFKIFAKSFAVAITNPKGLLFFSAILPQFVTPHAPQAPQYVVLALTFAAVDGLVMLAYASGGTRAVHLVRAPTAARWIERACGGALMTFAGALALYRRART